MREGWGRLLVIADVESISTKNTEKLMLTKLRLVEVDRAVRVAG